MPYPVPTPVTSDPVAPHELAAVRAFSRFYTSRIGALGDRFLDQDLPLPAARLVYELGAAGPRPASVIARDLHLDPGYVSRLVKTLVARGLVGRSPSPEDGRANLLSLSKAGAALFHDLEARSDADVAAMLGALASPERRQAVKALATAHSLLGGGPPLPRAYQIRPMQPGEGGWIIGAFAGALIREYGLEHSFEGFVGQIVVDFLNTADWAREHAWIAEVDGQPAGSIMLVAQSSEVAKLRLLVVDGRARGLGIGQRLVAECIRFARVAGYRRITLWTYASLVAARRLYADAGFRCTGTEEAMEFGQPMVNETWDLTL